MYTDYYGFTDRPFQLTPDARFYFDSRTHKKAMAYLGYGLAQGEGFIVITGDVGAGKSTLVAHLMATIDRARLNAINIVSTQVEGDDMLRLAAQGMGLFTQGVAKAQLLERVEQHLEDEARAGKRTLLIVDEAQNLPVTALEELRMLSNYQVGGQALLQIFLLGQPEFRDQLAHSASLEQLRQRVIATHHLEPMEGHEVEPYIVHRLGLVGWQGNPGFEPEAFAAIYRHTGGVPRRVNQLAGRVLLHASVEQLDRIDADAVAAVADEISADIKQQAEAPPARHSVSDMEAVRERRIADVRVAALEARLDEQERALRRVLTLLVDWVEKDQQAAGYRHNAA
jgi:putative secretion ATPase (PEP-CTERM system associated)